MDKLEAQLEKDKKLPDKMKFKSLDTFYDKSMNLLAKISFDKELLLFQEEDINQKPHLSNQIPSLLTLKA